MMKFGQWGDRRAKEDGSFSFAPVNVVNSSAHTAPSTLIKEEGHSCRAMEGLGFRGGCTKYRVEVEKRGAGLRQDVLEQTGG